MPCRPDDLRADFVSCRTLTGGIQCQRQTPEMIRVTRMAALVPFSGNGDLTGGRDRAPGQLQIIQQDRIQRMPDLLFLVDPHQIHRHGFCYTNGGILGGKSGLTDTARDDQLTGWNA